MPRDGALDRRSDVFSVGMILYELTTGQLPFTGETEYQLLDQIVNSDAPPPSTLVPDYPPALERDRDARARARSATSATRPRSSSRATSRTSRTRTGCASRRSCSRA